MQQTLVDKPIINWTADEIRAEFGTMKAFGVRREIVLPLGESELNRILQQAGEEKWSDLDLSQTNLEVVPHALFDLINLTKLSLSENQLSILPTEFVRLTNLIEIFLDRNQLVSLPSELGKLTNLIVLFVQQNQLSSIPSSIEYLCNLYGLILSENQLTSVPSELGNLAKLEILILSHNKITNLLPDIGRLKGLRQLFIDHNQLVSLPPELGKLSSLTGLYASNNQLTNIPPEIGNLNKLDDLFLFANNLKSIPPELGSLNKLSRLYLTSNQLTNIPVELGNLTELTRLSLSYNHLLSVPAEVGKLLNLTELGLSQNQLTHIPPELANLFNLTELGLSQNQLSSMPAAIGNLAKLTELHLSGNPLVSPPPEVVEAGTEAVLAYLRDELKGKLSEWISKLIFIGEGGVGKTSLLRRLHGEPAVVGEAKTDLLETGALTLSHPDPAKNNIELSFNTWDFGGQEVYHATHQFYLSEQSLFILIWDARQGWEMGKLDYWLDMIKARANGSWVILVKAHADEHIVAEVPISLLKQRYEFIHDRCLSVNNNPGNPKPDDEEDGVAEVRRTIQVLACDPRKLPLMGSERPSNWGAATRAVQELNERKITPERLFDLLRTHGIPENSLAIVGQYLHNLGYLLWFQKDDMIRDLVILKPGWVSEYIARVLNDDVVKSNNGLLHRERMIELWKDLDDPSLYNHFLRLMEQFDLSYRTLEDREISLVVECLKEEPVTPYETEWNRIKEEPECKELSMKFYLNASIPPGIPTYFIARFHRHSIGHHWLRGALFADEPKAYRHLGLIQAFPVVNPYIQITVRGPQPYDFFSQMRTVFEDTLRRSKGIYSGVMRKIPCQHSDESTCSHEYDLATLERRLTDPNAKKKTIECPISDEDVPVSKLLYGLHLETTPDVIVRAEEFQVKAITILNRVDTRTEQEFAEAKVLLGQIIADQRDLISYVHNEFLRLFRLEQAKMEILCPTIFTLYPEDTATTLTDLKQTLFGRKLFLHLWCEVPGGWHQTPLDGNDCGRYAIECKPEWLQPIAPHIAKIAPLLKKLTNLAGAGARTTLAYQPVGTTILGMLDPAIKAHVDLLNSIVDLLPDLRKSSAEVFSEHFDYRTLPQDEPTSGSDLRALFSLLKTLDDKRVWGGLNPVEVNGTILYLCDEHAKIYRD